MIRHNLFISNFNIRKIGAIFLVFAVIICFLAGNSILNYLYWAEDNWCRILWHNYYGRTENIEYLYLGSSHVYCDLNPEILGEKNEKNNFNMAVGSGRLIDSYYLLKEAERHNKIEKVYVEMYYCLSTGVHGNYQERESTQIGWRWVDYMKPSFYKMATMASMNPIRYYPEAMFPFIRYREHLMDGNWIRERNNAKSQEDYKNYNYNDGVSEFRDKGYYYTTRELGNLLFNRDRKPEEMQLTEDAETYLRKIVEYCQRKDISITLFSSPMYEIQPISTGNYDCYADQIKDIATEYGIAYYDFNMVKEEFLPIQNPEYFMDIGHLNAKGAEIYTDFFHQVVTAPPDENEKYFYHSYQEKLENTEPKVYGIFYYDVKENESGKNRKMEIASNRDSELEYQIFLTVGDEERHMLQDFTENKEFCISPEEHGVCQIIWRSKNDRKNTESMEITY